MSSLQYGVVVMDQLRTEHVQRLGTLDGPNFVYGKWRITVEGVWNPALNTYTLPQPNPTADPFSVAGQRPALTDVAIWNYLMVPRRQLYYTVGRDLWLTSPGVQANGVSSYLTDSANGPIPIDCQVWAVRGEALFRIRFVVDVAIAGDEAYTTTPSVMLNHVWQVTCDIDRDGYETRTIDGRVLFRSDILLARGVFPDDFRNFIAPPIETGFRRDNPSVAIGEDGMSLQYRVVDRQTATTVVGDANISWIEAYQTAGVAKNDLARATVQAILALRKKEVVGALAAVVGAVIPLTTIDIVCKVWGGPTAPRSLLRDAAMLLISTRLSLIGDFAKSTGAVEISLTEDLAGTFVEMKASIYTMIAQFTINQLGISLPDPRVYFPANDDTAGVLQFGQPWATARLNDGGMRANSLKSIVAAALRNPQATPTRNTAVNLNRQRQQLSPP